jgi:hypothetical protein
MRAFEIVLAIVALPVRDLPRARRSRFLLRKFAAFICDEAVVVNRKYLPFK